MRRVGTKVSDAEAKARLEQFKSQHGIGPHRAAQLADVIWLDAHWRSAQGAGAAASRVLKRLGCQRTCTRDGSGALVEWGWLLRFSIVAAPDFGRVKDCTCGMIACVCNIKQRHKPECKFRRAAVSTIEIECEHGHGVCPKCDPCDCGASDKRTEPKT